MRPIQRQMGGPTQDEMKIELIGDENLVALLALRNISKAGLPIDLRSICEGLTGESRDMALKSLDNLEAKSPEEIRAEYSALKTKRALVARELKERDRAFNQPGAMADFEHWAKMASWTIDEAIALSLSRDPRSVAWPNVQNYTKTSDLAKAFEDRRQIAHSAVKMRQLYASNTPAAFIAWARDQVRMELPADLIGEVESLGYTIANWKTLFDQLSERYDSALKNKSDGHRTSMDEALKRRLDAKGEMIDALANEVKKLQGEPANQTRRAPQVLPEQLSERRSYALQILLYAMAVAKFGYNPDKPAAQTKAKIRLALLDLEGKLTRTERDIGSHLKDAKSTVHTLVETFFGPPDNEGDNGPIIEILEEGRKRAKIEDDKKK